MCACAHVCLCTHSPITLIYNRRCLAGWIYSSFRLCWSPRCSWSICSYRWYADVLFFICTHKAAWGHTRMHKHANNLFPCTLACLFCSHSNFRWWISTACTWRRKMIPHSIPRISKGACACPCACLCVWVRAYASVCVRLWCAVNFAYACTCVWHSFLLISIFFCGILRWAKSGKC